MQATMSGAIFPKANGKVQKKLGERTFLSSLEDYGLGPWLRAAGGEHSSIWPLECMGCFRGFLMRKVASSWVAVAVGLKRALEALDITRWLE